MFVPTRLSREIGADVKERVERNYSFEFFYYHLARGGHVSALHQHRPHKFFCKIDIDNFFYSIARNRVVRALRGVGVERHEHYGKWSCVKNPFDGPAYAIPYGFVQSPIISSLVLSLSGLGKLLRALSQRVEVSVYVDDIALSSDDPLELRSCYLMMVDEAVKSGFSLSPKKCVEPSERLSTFNCDVELGKSVVREERRAQFYAEPRSPSSIGGFELYCSRVEKGNV